MRQNGGAVLLWLGAGALLMFYLDPARGRRRRALVRDKFVRAGHVAAETIDGTRRDLGNRWQGVKARVQRLREDDPVDDAVLGDRVRAQLGRYTTQAGDITVDVSNGEVTLRGCAVNSEAKKLIRAVSRVPGVCNVIDLLEHNEDPAGTRASVMSVPVALLIATGAAGAAVAARAAVNRPAARL